MPGDIPSVCIALAFRQVVRLSASRPALFPCLCLHTPQLVAAPPFRCLPSLFSCAHMDEPQCMRLTTRVIRSQHYTLSNSYKLVRLHRPLCRCRPPHESHMMQGLQGLCPAHRSHSVLLIHRFGRAPPALSQNGLLSATLAEAATQLSFAAFLERCTFVNASPPPQLPVPTPSLDAATQTFSHTVASRDASMQLSFREFLAPPSVFDVRCPACARPVPSLPLDAAVQTPLHSVATHDASTRLPLTEFFIQ